MRLYVECSCCCADMQIRSRDTNEDDYYICDECNTEDGSETDEE